MENKKLENLRHSTAHLLAAAVLELFPGTENAIGPAVENGFYTDFDFGNNQVSETDFDRIEAKMHEIVKKWKKFEIREATPDEARKLFKHNKYKTELINDLAKKNEKITINNPGEFLDLCRGGHLDDPAKEISSFKLLSIAGAYWKGSEKNKMLTRIYGTAFPTKIELDDHLAMFDESKKRNHRKLGQELDLFVFSELVGKGLPLFTPKGTILRSSLDDYSQKLRTDRGFEKVWIPHITKNDLYKTSGHWDKFGAELFLVKSQETDDELVMKPMNCPHHQQIYASRTRSYRDLPIKYLETTTIYRDEKAGELLGLSRVRSVTQDDSHVFCTPDQIENIYQEMIEITKEFYKAINMKFKARLSFRDPKTPEKYLGEPKLWDKAQEIILNIAKKNKLDYYTAEGEAAFYGPKIDFMALDALGRQWQLATPQLDFVQPKRFGLTYINTEGEEQTPVMIHFALMGSIERFLSVYIEHTGGAFPTWLAPVQIMLFPISDKHTEFTDKLNQKLKDAGIRSEVDNRSERLQAKIRDAALQKVPFMGIIGDKEMESDSVSVRERGGKDLGTLEIASLVDKLKQTIDKKI